MSEKIPREDLLDEIRRLAEEKGGAPTSSEMESCGKYGSWMYQKTFDSWNKAIEAAEFKPRTRGSSISEEELLDEIHRLVEKKDRKLTQADIREEGRYAPMTYTNNFGSWSNAVEEAGFEPRRNVSGPENWQWKDIEPYTGPDWRSQRQKTRDRDNNSCRVCGISKQELDREISVHHITPRSDFIEEAGGGYDDVDWETCDGLENLICLCPEHHHMVEGRWTELDHEEFEQRFREHLAEDDTK